MSLLRILGIERLTVDSIVANLSPTDRERLLAILGPGALPDAAVFCDSVQWQALQQLGLLQMGAMAPGGCVANSLVAAQLANARIKASEPLDISWAGPSAGDRHSQKALRSLIEAGIQVSPVFVEGGTTRTICLNKDPEGSGCGATILINLGRWPLADFHCRSKTDTLLVLGLDTVVEMPRCLSGTFSNLDSPVALLVNHHLHPASALDWLQALLNSGRLVLVCGRNSELEAVAALLDCPYVEWPDRFGCDVVSTLGADGVEALTADGGKLHEAAVSRAGMYTNTDGAGDAVFGVCLAALARREPLAPFLGLAMCMASESLQRQEARPPSVTMSTELLGSTPLSEEAANLISISEDISVGTGVTVLTGGQTGIDELALNLSAQFGLPGHAVFPSGLMREDGPLETSSWSAMGRPRIHELDSSGYRERTWATCYLGDATLLFDYLNSSGSRECAVACKRLGRQLFKAGENVSPEGLAAELSQAGIRTLNIAGHRGSLLTIEMKMAAESFLRRMLSAWARAWVQRVPESRPAILSNSRHKVGSTATPLVAIPNSGKMKEFITRKLCTPQRLSFEATGDLFISLPDIGYKLVLGRPRDMPFWLCNGIVSAALAGLDELLEGGFEGKILYDTGLFASSIVLLGPEGESSKESTIVSQIPKLAKRLLEHTPWQRSRVVEIAGAAESWINLGVAGFCVDTWHTGRAARANRLMPIATLGETSLCLVATGPTSAFDVLINSLR